MIQRLGVVALWAAAMACGLWLVTTKVSVHSELADLLPEGTTATQRLLLTQVRTGIAGRILLLAIEGGEPDALVQASREFGQQLRATGQFDVVGNGEQALAKLDKELLFRSRYLLSRRVSLDAFSADALRHGLEQRLDDLRSPLASLVKETIPGDPTGEFLDILAGWSGQEGAEKYRGVWMSGDHARALLVVETRAAGFDADAQAAIQQDIRKTFEALPDRPASLRLLMSGPGVFAVKTKHRIEAEVWWLSTAASTLVLLFLFASYRSVTLVLLSLIPLSTGIVAGIVAVNGWFGFIHGITLGFGITLLGIVDDYPIHLFSHLHARGSAPVAMRAIWPTMRLGVLTTVMGFSSLLLAGFPALAQLGLFAVAGLIAAALVTRWVLPLCVPAAFTPRAVPRGIVPTLAQLSKARWLVPAAAILATFALLWSDTPLWQTDLASLSPVSEAGKRLDQQLRGELGAPDVRDLLVIEGPTAEDVLQRGEAVMAQLEQLRAEGLVAGYDLVSTYLPSRRSQQARQQSLPERSVLASNLQIALAGLPFAPGLFAPFLDAVESARTQSVLDREAFRGTALGLKLATLLVEQQGRWTAVVPLRGVADRPRLGEAVVAWQASGVAYVDLKEESNRLMTAYRDRTVAVAAWGLLAIAVVLAVGLRSVAVLWPVLMPMLSALLVVAALLNAMGESLSLFHVATFLLVIGLGLDYALFFNRPEGADDDRARTLYGLLVCSMTTILVFGVLACSMIPLLHAIGITAAAGSFCCLLFGGMMAGRELSPNG
ncbi:MAG: membrane protein, inferred for ABFAE pathway [Nitrospira sp.]|nr:MAG: membrane protein, inferred for ABFAE pathway [Nitrospira sp.]